MILVWAMLLLMYEAATSVLTRAVASKNLLYHTIASVVTNALYLTMQLFTVLNVLDVLKNQSSTMGLITLGVVYITCAVTGSVVAHWFAMKKGG